MMTNGYVRWMAVCAVLFAAAGCGSNEPPSAAAPADPCADPANRDSMNCKLASATPASTAEQFVYSYQLFCEKDGDRSRSINVTYRSAKSCEDAKSQVDRPPDPCTEFATEKWPGWRTWKKEPVYDLESCD